MTDSANSSRGTFDPSATGLQKRSLGLGNCRGAAFPREFPDMNQPRASSTAKRRRLFAALVSVLVLALVAAGCGDDEGAFDATGGDEAALVAATDDLVATCNDRDHARLRDLSGAGIQDRIRDQDNVFNNDVDDIAVVDRRVTISGDTALVAVTLEIVINGETREIERVWKYQRIDDAWVLSAVPDCIFS